MQWLQGGCVNCPFYTVRFQVAIRCISILHTLAFYSCTADLLLTRFCNSLKPSPAATAASVLTNASFAACVQPLT
jgi:hypothetical protein